MGKLRRQSKQVAPVRESTDNYLLPVVQWLKVRVTDQGDLKGDLANIASCGNSSTFAIEQ